MKTKYTNKQIWMIAYPILISLLMEQMIGMTDTAFLGRVGEVELGASAIAGVFYMVIFMAAFGFSIGAQILIARPLPPGPPHRGGPLADRRRSAAGLSGWGHPDLSRRTRFCHAGVSGGAVALGGAGLRGPDHAGGVGGFSAGGLQARTDGAGENAGDGKAAGGACPAIL